LSLGDLLITRQSVLGSSTHEKIAVVDAEKSLSFESLNSRVRRLCHAIASLGLSSEDRVSLLGYNRSEYIEAYLAAAKGAFVLVPLNFRLAPEELVFIVNDSGARVLIVDEDHLTIAEQLKDRLTTVEHLIVLGRTDSPGMVAYETLLSSSPESEPDLDPSPNCLLFILYTSGTTGLPKGVMLTHGNNLAHTEIMATVLGLKENDVTLHVCPFFHIASVWIILTHLFRGCTNIVLPKFDAGKVYRSLAEYPITNINLVPTMLYDLIRAPEAVRYKPNLLRLILYGAAPMPSSVLARGVEIFGPIFAQVYGLTEASPVLTYLPKEDHMYEGTLAERISSCGRPVPGVTVRVVDEDARDVPPGQVGEIIARGDTVTPGYWRRPEETSAAIQNGWFQTGDLARVDEAGYLYLVDRKKDMIISGGENIYCREIEKVLERHPAVREAAVVGTAHEKWGEVPEVWIVLSQDSVITAEELTGWCRSHLAHYKIPKSFRLVPCLPKSPSGKILKKEIRAKARSQKRNTGEP
jgi:acyl-CoA synthetase (AMP-forming)/AMP-acid ligase II